MKKWRYLVLSGAAVAWAGCADLPSFPENFGDAGTGGTDPSSSGSSTMPTTAGTPSESTGGTTAGTGTAMTTAGTAGTPTMTEAGSAGTPPTTTTGGMAGMAMTTGGMAGTGGQMTNPQMEIDDAVKALKAWRYENPCKYVDGHSITDGTCNSGEICFPSNAKSHFSEKKQIAIGGTTGHQYDVSLRIRGAIEPRDYPANCKRLANSSSNTVGLAEDCDGFANRDTVTFNVFELKIQDPPKTFYLNSVVTHPPHRVDPLDQTFTIRVAGGTKIDFTFDDLNGGEIRNCSVTVQGIAPFPKVFDGNFFQLDVIDAKLVP